MTDEFIYTQDDVLARSGISKAEFDAVKKIDMYIGKHFVYGADGKRYYSELAIKACKKHLKN